MPYNGSGEYVLPAPEYPAITGTTILADDYNAILEDIKAALSNVVCRDGQSSMTGNLNFAGFTLNNAVLGAACTATTQPLTDNSNKLATTAFAAGLAFQTALPGQSVATEGMAATSGVGGVAGWRMLQPTYPLGDAVPAGSMVARKPNGTSVAAGVANIITALGSSQLETVSRVMANGNIAVATITASSGDVTLRVESPTGAVLYGPVNITTGGSNLRDLEVLCLSNGNIAVAHTVIFTGCYYAIYSPTLTTVLSRTQWNAEATAYTEAFSMTELTTGAIAFSKVGNPTSYPSFTVWDATGGQVTAPTVIESAALSGSPRFAVVGLADGNLAVVYVIGANLRFAVVTPAGVSVVAPMTIATNVYGSGALNSFACQLVSGNLVATYKNSSQRPAFVIITKAGGSVVTTTELSTTDTPVLDNRIDVIDCVPLSGGDWVFGYCIASAPSKIGMRSGTDGQELFPPTSVGITTNTLMRLSKSLTAGSNSCYVSWRASTGFPTFMGSIKGNYLGGISDGYTSALQLVRPYGSFDLGSGFLDTLGKDINWLRVGSRIIF